MKVKLNDRVVEFPPALAEHFEEGEAPLLLLRTKSKNWATLGFTQTRLFGVGEAQLLMTSSSAHVFYCFLNNTFRLFYNVDDIIK